MAGYNTQKLRFGVNFNVNIANVSKKRTPKPKDSKTVVGLVINVEGKDRVGLILTGDPMYSDFLVIPFEEESLNTVGQDKVYLNDNSRITCVYKSENQVYPEPYKVYAINHLVEGTIRTLSDGTKVFHFVEDLGLLKKGEDAPINNLK